MRATLLLVAALACDSAGETPAATASETTAPSPPPAPTKTAPQAAPTPEPAVEAPAVAPFVPAGVFFHGRAPATRHARTDRGTPRFRIEPGTCIENGACIVPDGFPAIATDGSTIAVALERGFLYYDTSTESASTKALLLLALPELALGRAVEIVDARAATAHQRTHGDCCEPGDEEGCDPFLCDPDPRLVREVSREVRTAIAERMSEANALLRAGSYRTLVELQTSAETGSPTGLHAMAERDGEREVIVSVLEGGTTRFEARFSTDLDESGCELRAWLDPPTGQVLAEVTLPTDGEADVDGVETHYLAGELQPPAE
jgi:hypothetical protein